jgi:hypothetical protein
VEDPSVGWGWLAAVTAAFVLVCCAGTAGAGRAPVYSVTVTGSLTTSAFVPPHEDEMGCRHDGLSYSNVLSFRSSRAVRTSSLRTALPVKGIQTATGADHKECPDGAVSARIVDGPPRAVAMGPLALRNAGGRLWLDGAPEDVSGACLDAATPSNPLPLAGVYAGVPRAPKKVGGVVKLRGEEDEQAQSDGCQLVRSVRWTLTLRRVR